MINKKIILLTIALVGLISLTHIKADTGVTLSPANSDITLKSDESYSGSFNVTNNETTDFNIAFQEATSKNNSVEINEFNWLKVTNQDTILKAGQTLKIDYKVTVPKDSEKGVYNKLLLVNLYTDSNLTKLNLAIPFKINIFVDSLFSSPVGITIKKLETSSKFSFNNNIKINITVGNIADNQISKPIGYLNIVSAQGQIVYSQIINETLLPLTTDQSYSFEATIPRLPVTDVGQYTVEVLFTDSLSGKSIVKKITYISLDSFYLLIIFGVLAAILFLVRFFNGFRVLLKSSKEEESTDSIGLKKETKRKKLK